jgi:hypothetical protein
MDISTATEGLTWLDWAKFVEAPVLLAMLGLLIRHQMQDHIVELEVKTTAARMDGRLDGMASRVTRLEDISDDRSADDRRARRASPDPDSPA